MNRIIFALMRTLLKVFALRWIKKTLIPLIRRLVMTLTPKQKAAIKGAIMLIAGAFVEHFAGPISYVVDFILNFF